ncbi:class I SAM-dependent methyltransferase [Yunchengibacter salinarum]|uniref:class I SAM-dependent methyltransferase n=1 Tax=Yunchengibacter salinarum TaxID=3133399 RepID=UPI0035B678F0
MAAPAPLLNRLARRIRAEGPLTMADYMTAALMDPRHGYYQQKQVFGTAGDFITAPEISQMFGEVIGLTMAHFWDRTGRPENSLLVELGPGRGTCMADMRRALAVQPAARQALAPHMVEASARLKTLQKQAVPDVIHHTTPDSLPDGPIFLLGNEFLDALPVHQFEKRDGQWLERRIGLADDTAHTPRLVPVLTHPGAAFALLDESRTAAAPDGTVLEVCPAARSLVATLADRLSRHGGAAVLIDYGSHRPGTGDTVQAVKDHAYADPLAAPGTADITAHVDFAALVAIAEEQGIPARIADQGAWLMEAGLGLRAEQLAAGADESTRRDILAALKRLTAPDQMGTLFKVLTLGPIAATLEP